VERSTMACGNRENVMVTVNGSENADIYAGDSGIMT